MIATQPIVPDTDSRPSTPSTHGFATPMPVSLATLQRAGVQFDFAEAVAIGQALCLACTGVQSREKNDDTVGVVMRFRRLDNETVLIDPTSRLGVRAVDPGDEATAIHYIGRVLAEIVPREMRRKVEARVIAKALASPPRFGSLTDLSDALTKFENGQRRELIQQVYERWQSASLSTEAASPFADAGPPSGIRLGSSTTAVRTAIIVASVVLGSVSATILITRASGPRGGGTPVTEEGGVRDTNSKAGTLLESRPIAPLASGLVGWSVARANPPAAGTTVMPLQRDPLRRRVAAAPAAAKMESFRHTTVAQSVAREESSAVVNPPMPRPATNFPTPPPAVRPAPPTPEPARSSLSRSSALDPNARPLVHPNARPLVDPSARSLVYSGRDSEVVPPTPILPRLLAALAPSSPGVSLDALVIAVVVDEHGRAYSVNGVNPPQNMSEAILLTSALAAVKQWQFDPAMKDGVPVRYRLIVPLRSVIESAR